MLLFRIIPSILPRDETLTESNVTMKETLNGVFFGIVAAIAIVGNIILMILFARKHNWLKKVHTCLLLSLAIQDIMTAITLLVLPGFVLPIDVFEPPKSPIMRDLFCTLVWSWFVPFALSIVSIYTCLMLAIDRCFAVWKPFTYKKFFSSKKVIATMLILPWILGFVCEIRTALNIQSSTNDDGSYTCKRIQVERSPESATVALFLFLGKGLLPATLMTAAYVKMMASLKRSSSRLLQATGQEHSTTDSSNSSPNQRKSHLSLKRITRMACAASALVVICWLPDQVYYFIFELRYIQLENCIHDGLHILAFLNTCLNPFLYSFSNKEYKKEFKMILCCMFNRCSADRA